MSTTAQGYLAEGTAAAGLVSDPAVAERWAEPSALAGMSVGALAGHLARQIFNVEAVLAQEACDDPPIPLLEHYARSAWPGAAPDDPSNVAVRDSGAAEAAVGPAALARRTTAALGRLSERLPGEPPDQVVLVPWGPWPLTLADLLITRMMEIAVHDDDLACSVGLPTPALPDEVTDTVVVLLARLAVRRHGPDTVVRAFSRAERAPATIAAF
ncbi:MAG: maleylpyruvate isomerase N-terminal domain-containing protein [Streptosporangiaceae bacterium]